MLDTNQSTSTNLATNELKSVGYHNLLKRGAGTSAKPNSRTIELQKLLKQKGLDLKVDGAFGPATEQKLKQFQKAYNQKNPHLGKNKLLVDGIVGPRTLAALLNKTLPPQRVSLVQAQRRQHVTRTKPVTNKKLTASTKTPKEKASLGKVNLRTPSQVTTSHEEGLERLGINPGNLSKTRGNQLTTKGASNSSGIRVWSSSGRIGHGRGETGLAGMRHETLDYVSKLNRESGKSILITGGTEIGSAHKSHKASEQGHHFGHKVDIQAHPGISRWIRKNLVPVAAGYGQEAYLDKENNALLVREGTHWDIQVKTDKTDSLLS